MATKVGNRWRGQVRLTGYKPQTKMFALKSHAEAWEAKRKLELQGEVPGYSGDDKTIREVLEKFRDEVSPTRKGERWEMLRIDQFLRNYSWVELRASKLMPAIIREWRDARLKEVSGSTVCREMNVLGGIISHAIKEGWINLQGNPIHLVGRPAENKPRTQRCTDAELTKIVGPFPTEEPKCPKDFVAYAAYLAVETAMRQGEICQLTWSDIDVENLTVHAIDEWTHETGGKSIKNGSSREIPLSSRACQIINTLAGFAEEAPMEANVFGIESGLLSKHWGDMAEAAGLGHIHFHDLRREATTRLAPQIGDVMELASVTGHKDIRTLTEVYYKPKAKSIAQKLA